MQASQPARKSRPGPTLEKPLAPLASVPLIVVTMQANYNPLGRSKPTNTCTCEIGALVIPSRTRGDSNKSQHTSVRDDAERDPVALRLNGYDLRFDKTDSALSDSNRILGIRLDKLDVTAPSTGFMDGNITLTLSNVGGTNNGAVIGGCLTYFTVHRQGDTYVAKYSGSFDP